MQKLHWQCRIAPSLGGGFEGTPSSVWGTSDYYDQDIPTVFFGMYGLPDFYTLWRHVATKVILWAGSDIQHFINGYWLDATGEIRLDGTPLAEWINKNCECYVENGVEHEALMALGVESKIVPSFLGNIDDYEITYKQAERPRVYLSVSGDNFAMYGFELVEKIADRCNVDFYLYGSDNWTSEHSNVIVRGRVPKDEMNEEIKYMQAGLRPLEFDGCSEITVKSVLWGQHAISRIPYPYVDSYETNEQLIFLLNNLKNRDVPNTQAISWFRKNLNRYPFNANLHNKSSEEVLEG